MDEWINCAYGVDCDTHRRALGEIQKLRDEVDDLNRRIDKIHKFVTEQAA
jgi:hypothetical protein